jgi:hypothetical protein
MKSEKEKNLETQLFTERLERISGKKVVLKEKELEELEELEDKTDFLKMQTYAKTYEQLFKRLHKFATENGGIKYFKNAGGATTLESFIDIIFNNGYNPGDKVDEPEGIFIVAKNNKTLGLQGVN